jgi:outer membrane receptor protein involved in Fe transport
LDSFDKNKNFNSILIFFSDLLTIWYFAIQFNLKQLFMTRLLTRFGLFCAVAFTAISAMAQNAGTIAGTVKNATTGETVAAVSVTVKGTSVGTYTDDKGTFRLNVSQKAPYTLVFSSVGFENQEQVVSAGTSKVDVSLKQAFTLGTEVVVAASRVAERILESPVTIERVSNATIKNAPVSNYYDLLGTLKGVDVNIASLTFKSISTRGFNGSGNSRLNQFVDGMDNQAPGLNFSVASIIGLTELDVDNIELLPGASSALYGQGGMNGTVLINSKSPFKYQGLSFQIKQGMNHVDNKQRPLAPFKDWTVRYAKKIGDRFAYKFSMQYTEADDWRANSNQNYSRTTGSPNGQTIAGTRLSDPNYDGVNFYGDETSANLADVGAGVRSLVRASLISSLGQAAGAATFDNLYNAAAAYPTLAAYQTFLTGAGGAALGANAAFLWGDRRGYFNNVNVSRTGYAEQDVVDPTALNIKFQGSLHYKINDNVEASFAAYNGSGNTVYTGSDRYSIKDFSMGQYKLELKSRNWYVRAYTTLENSGASFNSTIAARYFNEKWKDSRTSWFPTYAATYSTILSSGASEQAAHAGARANADVGRPTGYLGNNPMFQSLVSTPISQGGAMFLERTSMRAAEGQYNLTEALGLAKYDADLLVGASARQFILNSQGTLFADTAGNININESGAYAQLSKRFFGDLLKFSVSGRYDKNENFKGRFTPRASMVVKLKEDHNLRVSYQTAYRFPTTQNQWINLLVGGGTRLMGGLPQLRKFYNFDTNPAYTLASVTAFGASALAGAPNPALLKVQTFSEFKPESMNSFEVGYKGLVAKKLLIDFYYYFGQYENFISGVTVLQSNNPAAPKVTDVLSSSTRIAYSISTNSTQKVKTSGWGLSLDYLLPANFSVSSSIYGDQIGDLEAGFVSYFNTPKMRTNVSLNNSGFAFKNRLGFSAIYRYQDSFTYEGTFGVGRVSSFNTLDAVLTYKLPSMKSLMKLGGTNIMNTYYNTAHGSPQIGGLYYVSFAYNVF